jgi:hypothetical protein
MFSGSYGSGSQPTSDACVGNPNAFNAGFGNCRAYAPFITTGVIGEYAFCSSDTDLNHQLTASSVCFECGMCTDESQTEPEDVFRGLTFATWQTMLPVAAGDEAVDVMGINAFFGFEGSNLGEDLSSLFEKGEAPFVEANVDVWVSDGFG